MSEVTKRQREALELLEKAGRPLTPSLFAYLFWPDTKWARGYGPWGLGPDSSGRTGGRMLNGLKRLGLVRFHYDRERLAYTAAITSAGRRAIGVKHVYVPCYCEGLCECDDLCTCGTWNCPELRVPESP